MKKICVFIMVFAASLLLSSTMEVHRTDGTSVIIELGEINNITFTTGTGGYTGPEMITVPAGSFEMGQIDVAEPAHNVTLTNDFSMSKYEITNQDYCIMLNYALVEGLLTGDYANNITVMNADGDQQELLNLDDQWCEIEYSGGVFIPLIDKANYPVILVTWHGAVFYGNMLSRQNDLTELYNLSDWSCDIYPTNEAGYRLPTEAEWEYAAQYNDERDFPWGNDIPTSDHANYMINVGSSIDVGSYSPLGDSQLGFCDMAGNAWEWCNDWNGDYSSNAQTNPTGPATGQRRIHKGGTWDGNGLYLRPAYRWHFYPYLCNYGIGFRITKIGE